MKKFFALVLALAFVCSLGAVAFAAGSPTKEEPSAQYVPVVAEKEEEKVEKSFAVYDNETDEAAAEVAEEDIIIADVTDADTLEEADKEAFLAAYEAAKAVEGKVVKDFFWLDLANDYGVGTENYLKFIFTCEGENVQVQVNGNDMEVVPMDEPDTYYAKLTELGAVAILCDAE